MDRQKLRWCLLSVFVIAMLAGIFYFYFIMNGEVRVTEGTLVYEIARMYEGVPL